MLMGFEPRQLSGSVCAHLPAAPGSNSKHNIYGLFNLYLNCDVK